jgi:hypothetical protein
VRAIWPPDLDGKHLVLGFSGGVVCYKAAELTAKAVVTDGAEHFFALRDGVYVDAHFMARLHPNPPKLPALP